MPDCPIPPRLWARLVAFLSDMRTGRWPGGGQITLNVSGQGVVTSIEVKGRDGGGIRRGAARPGDLR